MSRLPLTLIVFLLAAQCVYSAFPNSARPLPAQPIGMLPLPNPSILANASNDSLLNESFLPEITPTATPLVTPEEITTPEVEEIKPPVLTPTPDTFVDLELGQRSLYTDGCADTLGCGGGGGPITNVVKHYYYGDSGLVAVGSVNPSGGVSLEWIHSDYLGSTRAVSKENGALSGYIDYQPFGGEIRSTVPVSRRYLGEALDRKSALNYFGARYYDAGIGRFLSTDPLLTWESPYVYSHDNPLRFNDASGMAGNDKIQPRQNFLYSLFKLPAKFISDNQRKFRDLLDAYTTQSFRGRPVVQSSDFQVNGDISVPSVNTIAGIYIRGVRQPVLSINSFTDFSLNTQYGIFQSMTGSGSFKTDIDKIRYLFETFSSVPYSKAHEDYISKMQGQEPIEVGKLLFQPGLDGCAGGVCRSKALGLAAQLQRASQEGLLPGWTFKYQQAASSNSLVSDGHAWVMAYKDGAIYLLDPTTHYFSDPAYWPLKNIYGPALNSKNTP